MKTSEELRRELERIDGQGYRAYKRIAGSYRFDGFTLFIDHVQGDPFAAPTKIRLRVPGDRAGIPEGLYDNRIRRMALEDHLARIVRSVLPREPREGSGGSGLLRIDAGGQEVLERTAARVAPEHVEARLEVGLPAAGRRILGRAAIRIFFESLPEVVSRALLWTSLDGGAVETFVDVIENHAHFQRELAGRGLVAFVADGAVLPRESGVSDLPMKGALAFRSPETLRIELPLLHPSENDGRVTGMGIPEGVTLIVGGGYHGKSTLLRALERGVYPHIPGDGRERVATRRDAVKVRAEDGRHVSAVDISCFVRELPGPPQGTTGTTTTSFTTEDASGSTSQAASLVEALEAGARVLLFDEDTSATNFMVRDARMQALVAPGEEPIVPLVDRIGELHRSLGVSSVLVMGSSGDYFDEADTVVRMKRFLPDDVTKEAGRIAQAMPTERRREGGDPIRPSRARRPELRSVDASRGRRGPYIEARGLSQIVLGRETIDLRAVEQLVDVSQTRAVGAALHWASSHASEAGESLAQILDRLEAAFDRDGLDLLALFGREGEHPGNFARPRRFEISAALNRLRSLSMKRVE